MLQKIKAALPTTVKTWLFAARAWVAAAMRTGDEIDERDTALEDIIARLDELLADPDRLEARAVALRAAGAHDYRDYRMAWPPGHYYSPIPALSEVRRRAATIFATPRSIPGIDLREGDQLSLLSKLATYYSDQPFERTPKGGLRYHFGNDFFGYGDALVLHALLRHLRPARVIEVGSGFSSAVMLDTADRFLDGTQFTFVDPNAERLDKLLAGNVTSAEIVRLPLHDVDLSVFTKLRARDILFVDSTHVAKAGSEVNRLIFDVLPSLQSGVIVHFHDIFYPFEYPADWIESGRSWNEAYLLRAFLMFNHEFKIILWNPFLETFHASTVEAAMPLWRLNPGGSLWLERT